MVRYAQYHNFLWLWLVPAVAALAAYGIWQRRRALAAFFGRGSQLRSAAELLLPNAILKSGCIVLAVGLMVVALTQPQWGKYWTQQRAVGRDILVAIDVSRSMLADDVTPSRLERAKADVRDLVAAVESSTGHRLGLIAFAGSASLKCPLTQVMSHFRLMLDELNTQSVPLGGTMIGDCIRLAIESFDEKTENFRDLILISDGEDMDSFPSDAAAAARQAGITIYSIGLGDSAQGSRIPITDKDGGRSFLEYHGEVVWSKLNESALRSVAESTGGMYIPAQTRTIDLDRIFHDVIEPKSKREQDITRRERLHNRFQWLLAPAGLLLLIELLIRDARTARPISGSSDSAQPADTERVRQGPVRQSVLPIATGIMLSLCAAARTARADDVAGLVREGNRLYEKGNYAEAAGKYGEAVSIDPSSLIPLFNQAAALYQSGDFAGAAKLYERARSSAPDDLRQRINYALGNCHLQQAMKSQSQPGPAATEAKAATQFYRDAINASPGQRNSDATTNAARYNMELAKRLIQMIQQQQQQQKKEQQDQNQSDESKGSGDKSEQQKSNDHSGDKAEERPNPDDQSQDGKQDKPQPQPSESQDEAENRNHEQAGGKLSPDAADDRLRSAIARAQLARARRLSEQQKPAKGTKVSKDW